MKDKLRNIAEKIHPHHLQGPVEHILRDEAISGKLILAALAAALLAANSPLAPWYDAFLHAKLSIGFGDWSLALDIQHWISEGLMVFFFLVGDLRHRKTAVLPFAAAIGGMIVPALIYVMFNIGQQTIDGWAIPTATDIALAIGLLALLGNRVPSSLRIFILTLAIVDDIIAVIIIALFYSAAINISALAISAVVASQLYMLGRLRMLPMWAFVLGGVVLWLLTYASGIHPSIVGALLGLIAPMSGGRLHGEQIAEKAEKAIVPVSTLVVVPLFAFANTGISLNFAGVNFDGALPLASGIILGLVVGKFVGIFGASLLMVKLGWAHLPNRAGWGHIAGTGLLAGVGFTVSIFVTNLAFSDPQQILVAKLSIFAASFVAAVIGLAVLRISKSPKHHWPWQHDSQTN
jgi:NhaA family Na+:H+ antiporter